VRVNITVTHKSPKTNKQKTNNAPNYVPGQGGTVYNNGHQCPMARSWTALVYYNGYGKVLVVILGLVSRDCATVHLYYYIYSYSLE